MPATGNTEGRKSAMDAETNTTSTIPSELQQVIDLHREMFGGWSMMAEENADPAENSQPQQAETPNPSPADEQLGDGGKKALDAERRRARDLEKQLKAANERLTAIEDAEKTDLQRATDAAAKAKRDAEAARQELARERIARKHRLSDDDTALLSGTEEQMEALAARLAAAQTPSPATPPEGGLPAAPAPPAVQAAAAAAAGDATAAYAAKVRMLADMSKTK